MYLMELVLWSRRCKTKKVNIGFFFFLQDIQSNSQKKHKVLLSAVVRGSRDATALVTAAAISL